MDRRFSHYIYNAATKHDGCTYLNFLISSCFDPLCGVWLDVVCGTMLETTEPFGCTEACTKQNRQNQWNILTTKIMQIKSICTR
jgi:hypothetical protein